MTEYLSGKGENSPADVVRSENIVFFAIVTLVYTGFSAGYLFISLYLIQIESVPLLFIGGLYLATGAIDISVQLLGGRLSDHAGTKTVALAGLIGSVVVYVLLTLLVYSSSPYLFYIFVFPLEGFFSGLFRVAVSSYISDRKTQDMASGMSLLYVGFNLGFTAGPFLGGLLVQISGYVSLFLFGTLMLLSSLVVAQLGIRSNPRYASRASTTEMRKTSLRRQGRTVVSLLILTFVSWFVIAFQGVPLSVYESKFLSLSSFEIGTVLATNGIMITLLQSYISRLIRVEKKARLYPVALGSAIMAAGFFLISMAQSFFTLMAAISITTLGEMMIAVPTQVVITLFSSGHNRGQYQGYYFAFSRTGASLSTFFGFLVFSIFATNSVIGWYILILVSMAASVAYAFLSPLAEKDYSKVARMHETDLN